MVKYKEVTEKINYPLDVDDIIDMPIDLVLAKLQIIFDNCKSLGYDNIRIVTDYHHYDGFNIQLEGKRQETDKERDKRLKITKKEREKKKQKTQINKEKRYNEYLKLKKIFEKEEK